MIRSVKRHSRLAKWGQRIAFLAVQLLIVAILAHRFGGMSTPVAFNIMAVAFTGGGIALLMGAIAWWRIWLHGMSGGGKAATAVVLGLVILAMPIRFLPNLLALPQINDVTTDTKSPPAFRALALEHGTAGPKPAVYPLTRFAEPQTKAYPDIGSMILDRSNSAAFDLVKEAVERMEWTIVLAEPPKDAGHPGRIEATERSMILGLASDVVVRVAGNDNFARIDIRSASRFGRHDLGQNADRIRRLVREVRAGLETGEKTVWARAEVPAPEPEKVVRQPRRSRPAWVGPRTRPVRVRPRVRDVPARTGRRQLRQRRLQSRRFWEQFAQ